MFQKQNWKSDSQHCDALKLLSFAIIIASKHTLSLSISTPSLKGYYQIPTTQSLNLTASLVNPLMDQRSRECEICIGIVEMAQGIKHAHPTSRQGSIFNSDLV